MLTRVWCAWARRNKLLVNEYKVDLHGLDAAQAVDALHDTLAKFAGEHSARLSSLCVYLAQLCVSVALSPRKFTLPFIDHWCCLC